MSVNKEHEFDSQGGLLWRWEVNPAFLRGGDNKKPQFTQKESDPELRYKWPGMQDGGRRTQSDIKLWKILTLCRLRGKK